MKNNQTEPDTERIYDLIVIGGGPAGTSAAIYASRGKIDTLVIDKDIGGSAMGGSHIISNYPGFPEPIEAEKLLKRMRKQAISQRTGFAQDNVIYTDFRDEIKLVVTPNGEYRARSVVIATGSMGREPSVKGEEEFIGRGVAYCAICDAPYFQDKTVVVVGQPDRVLEELELISRYAKRIYFLSSTGNMPPEFSEEIEDLNKIRLLPGYRLKEIVGDRIVRSVLLTGKGEDRYIETEGVFLYLQGNKPVLDFLTDKLERGEEGCLKVDEDMMTNIPGVFAVGDVTCKKVRQISIATAQGCKSALSVDRMLHHGKKFRSQWS